MREVREELGCEVAVTRRARPATSRSRPGYTLRVALAELVDGEPVPHEHDALRWLGPEELDDVAWLAPDLPFLAELRELLLDGHPLEGGNVGGAVRIGAHRPPADRTVDPGGAPAPRPGARACGPCPRCSASTPAAARC